MGIDVSKLNDSQLEMAVMITEEAKRQGIDPNYAVAQAYQESRLRQYDPKTENSDKKQPLMSNQNAYGIMQILPSTAGGFGFSKEDLITPEGNIRAGVAIMKHNLDKYQDPSTALLAYHQGEPTVDKYLKNNDLKHIGDKGLEYVAKINENYDLTKNTGYYQPEENAAPSIEEVAPPKMNWAGTGPEMSPKEYLSSGDFGTWVKGALNSDQQNMQQADKNVIANFGPEIKNDPKAYHEQFNAEYKALRTQQAELQAKQKASQPPAPSLRESLGQLATQIVEHPLQTGKSIIYESGKDLPEYIALAMAGGEGEGAAISGTILRALNAAKNVGKAGALGAGTNVARQTGEMGLGERQEINPQEVLNQAANFAVFDAGVHGTKAAFSALRGAPEVPSGPVTPPEPPPEITPRAKFTVDRQGNRTFDTVDMEGTTPPPRQEPPPSGPAPAEPEVAPTEQIPASVLKEPAHVSNAREFLGMVDSGMPPHQGVANSILEQFGLETRPEQPNATVNRLRQAVKRHDALNETELTNPPKSWEAPEQPEPKAPEVPDIYQQIQNAAEGKNPAGPVAAPTVEAPEVVPAQPIITQRPNDPAIAARINDFLPNAPEEVQNTVAQSNKYIQDLTDKINSLGYKVEDIKSSSPLHVQELKSKMSQIAGSTSSYLKNAEHIVKGNRFANPEKLAGIQDTLSSDFAKADELLATTPEQITQAEQNLQRQAAQREEAARIARQSDTFLAHASREGGIKLSDKLDVTGEDKGIPAGGYNRMFRANAKHGLQSFIELGKADKYLPPEMRLSTNAGIEGGYDATPAYNYLTEKIRNGEQIPPYKEEVRAVPEEEHNAFWGAPEEFDLEGQTNAEIKSAEDAKKQVAAEERVKENAPAAEEFNLTGSNRPADVAAAHGAQDMFGAKPEEKAPLISEDGIHITSPVYVGLHENGFKMLDMNDPRTYRDSAGDPHRTFEKNGVRVALEGDQLLFMHNNRINKGRGESKETTVSFIGVDKDMRGQGAAKEALQTLADIADQNNVKLYVEPTQLDKTGLTKEQLTSLYKKYGFENVTHYDREEGTKQTDRILKREPNKEVKVEERKAEAPKEKTEAELEAKEQAKENNPSYEDRWSDPDHVPFSIEKKGTPKPEDIPGHDNPYPATEEQAQRAPSLRVVANKLRRMHEQGKITSEEFAKGIKEILDFTKKEGTHQERVRGAEILKEKLQRALRKGEIGKDAVRLAEWFINKNPQLVDDLGISIKAPKEGQMASGLYNPLARIVVLMKGAGSDTTVVHEILHHLERMMPEPIRKAIRKAWVDSFVDAKRAADKGDDPALKKYYDDLTKYHLEGDEKAGEDVRKAIVNGDVDVEHYQNYNPSEFWAVNGSDIMADRFAAVNKGIVNRLKNWLREFGEKVKSFLGLKSDASILRALDSLEKGDGRFVTNNMLAAHEDYRSFDKRKAKDLQDEFDAKGIPQARHHGAADLKEMFSSGINHLKDIAKGIAEPKKSVNKMISGLDDALTNFQIQNIYGGIGLEKAEAARYGNKLFKEIQDSTGRMHKVAIASVAQMNALHSGHIASQVMLLGKLVFDPASQMFKAVKDKFSMRNVFSAEQAIYKKLGKDVGSTLIQSYLEAKRARSIQNEFLDRQAEFERAKAAGEDETKAKQDLSNIEFIYRQKIPKYFLVKDANGKVIRNREGYPIINDAAIDDLMAKDRQHPELKQIMDNWTAVNHNMLDNLVFGRVISKARGDHLKGIKDYVPWTRITDDMDELHAPASNISGLTNVPKEKRFARGETDKQINNIISNMVNNVMMMTRNSARNYAAVKIAIEFGTRTADGKLAVFPREGLQPDGALRANILMGGKRIIIEIKDPHVAQAMVGMETMELPMMKFLGTMNQFGRRGITTNPFFQLWQVVKDAPTAAAVTGLKNPVLAAARVLGSFGSALMPNDPIVKILKSYGIGGFQLAGRTAEKNFALDMKVQNHDVLSFILKALDHIGDASDYAQRRIIYKQVLKETGNETQALFAANQVIDFMRHGNGKIARFEVQTVAFMGAFANQIDVLGDAMTGRRLAGVSKGKAALKFWLATGAFMTLASVYAIIKMNDPNYQALDDQTKLRNWVIGGYKIPMLTSYSFIYKALPELALNYVMTKGTDNEMDQHRLESVFFKALGDSLLGPNPIPSGFRAPLEIITNHDFFTGNTVTPKGLEGLETFEKFNSSTSELGKRISAASMGALNPIQADHLIKGWFATAGSLAMWASDLFTSDKPEKTWNQNPLVGQLFLSPTPHGPEERFYDLQERSDKAYKTWTTYQSREREAEAENYFNKNQAVIQLHDYITGISEKLKEINGEMSRIADVPATEMSAAEKTEQLIYYKNLKNEILEDVNQYRLMAERGEDVTAQ